MKSPNSPPETVAKTTPQMKIEIGQDEKGILWYVYIDGLPSGEPLIHKHEAKLIADWLDGNPDIQKWYRLHQEFHKNLPKIVEILQFGLPTGTSF